MDPKLLKELDAVKPIALTEQCTYLKALLYGDWGVGKTVTACSSGKSTLLITSGDGGESALTDYPDIKQRVRTISFRGISHIKAIFKAIEEGHPDYKDYEVVVIDTISSICDQYLKNMVDNYTIQNDRVTAKPKAGGTALEGEGRGDYRFLSNHLNDLAPVSIAAPVDVIWLSHEREPSTDEQAKGNYLTRPKMPQGAADAVAQVCHLVGNLEKKKQGSKVSYTLNFCGSNRLAAKSRIKALNDKTIDVSDFWRVVERWRES